MVSRSMRLAVAMYRGGALSLAEAANRGAVTRARMEAALRARAIPVREAPDPVGQAGV